MGSTPEWALAREGRTGKDDYFVGLLVQPQPIGMGDVVRFDHSREQWHVWDGYRWAPDRTGRVYDMIRGCFNEWASSDLDGDVIKAMTPILNHSKKESALRALSSEPSIAMRGDEWDPDPELMAFTNGVLNLRTGVFNTKPDPKLLLSRSTGHRYNVEANAAMFVNFLRDVMGNDAEMAEYLARVLGYSMIGTQREQKFWMWVGPGQNGKGVLARTMGVALGDYASTPPDTLYMKTRHGAASSDKPRPELLRLQGVRFTYMSEPQGGQFNEPMLKAHSGNDDIEARDLYAGSAQIVQWRPTHTIIFLTNDPPRTEDVGPSMQRRVRIIKFEQDYRGARDNKDIEDVLKQEENIEGMLLGLTIAAKSYYASGLREPKQVSEWSAAYIEENDPLAVFIEEACVTDAAAKGSGALLWAAYQDWCARHNSETGSQTGFGLAMGRRFRKEKTRTGAVYYGIRPKSAVDLADETE